MCFQHLPQQRRGGRFSLGAGDADDRGRASLYKKHDLGDDRHTGLAGGDEIGIRRRDRRGCDDAVGFGEILPAVFTEPPFNRQGVELPDGIGEFVGGGLIGDEHLRALLNQPSGGGDVPAKTAKPRDGDALVAVVFHPRILLDFHNQQGQIILRLQAAGFAVEVV